MAKPRRPGCSLESVLWFLVMLLILPFWLLIAPILDLLSPWSLDDPDCRRLWRPRPSLALWRDPGEQVPDPEYYRQLMEELHEGDERHQSSGSGPVRTRRVWAYLEEECQRLSQVPPEALAAFHRELLLRLGPLADHLTTPIDLDDRAGHVTVGALLLRDLGHALCQGLVDHPERWPEIARHYPELWTDAAWMKEAIKTLPGCPEVWPEPPEDRGTEEDWQQLWYWCCTQRPGWAVALADHPRVDPHAEGERGYALLIHHGHHAEADQLQERQGVDWEVLWARCRISGVLQTVEQRERRRRTKSARSGLPAES